MNKSELASSVATQTSVTKPTVDSLIDAVYSPRA